MEEGEEEEDDGEEDEVPLDEEADVEDGEDLGSGGMHVHDMHLGDAAAPNPAAAPSFPPRPAADERPALQCALFDLQVFLAAYLTDRAASLTGLQHNQAPFGYV